MTAAWVTLAPVVRSTSSNTRLKVTRSIPRVSPSSRSTVLPAETSIARNSDRGRLGLGRAAAGRPAPECPPLPSLPETMPAQTYRARTLEGEMPWRKAAFRRSEEFESAVNSAAAVAIPWITDPADVGLPARFPVHSTTH